MVSLMMRTCHVFSQIPHQLSECSGARKAVRDSKLRVNPEVAFQPALISRSGIEERDCTQLFSGELA